ncbi:MAG: hypothetical protein Q9192_006207 [Flavoplaca navasiana]
MSSRPDHLERTARTGLAEPPSASLITYIKKRDDLPDGSVLSKRSRRSPGDTGELEVVSERHCGVDQSFEGVSQASSMPASPVSPTGTRPQNRESLAFPASNNGRIDETSAGTAIPELAIGLLALAGAGLSSAAAGASNFGPLLIAPAWKIMTAFASITMMVASVPLFLLKRTPWITMVRECRSSLPGTMASVEDTEYFEQMYGMTEGTIVECGKGTKVANKVIAATNGLINMHILGTPAIVERVRKRDFVSSNAFLVSTGRPLAETLVLWNSYGLIYLPAAFPQTLADKHDLESVEMFKAHVREIQRRARKLRSLIVELQEIIFSLEDHADAIHQRHTIHHAADKKRALERGTLVLRIREKVLGPADWEGVEVQRRAEVFQSWAPKFKYAGAYLGNIGNNLSMIEEGCQNLIEMLDAEALIVRTSGEPSAWAQQQVEALDRGIQDLELVFGGYKAEQRAFMQRVFDDPEHWASGCVGPKVGPHSGSQVARISNVWQLYDSTAVLLYVLGAQEPIARTLVSQEYGNATLGV